MVTAITYTQQQSKEESGFDYSMEFIQSWYRNRDISKKTILRNFDYEEITIKDYLAPDVARSVIKLALDAFRENLIDQIGR